MFLVSTIGSTIIRWIITKRNNISVNNFATKKNLYLKFLKGCILNMLMKKDDQKHDHKTTMVMD
jgi:hypothetical protein